MASLFDRAGLRIYAEFELSKKGDLALVDLAALQQNLGVSFNDLSRLEQALVHSSYINENPGLAPASNERLEFLGDAVLGLIVAEKLFQDFPHLSEGEMTKLRAALVRRDTLTRMAKALKLGDHLYLGKGEEASGGRLKAANLAAVLEAVIAAIFLDQGIPATRDFILKLLAQELENIVHRGAEVDYKSALQELIQAQEQETPGYHVIAVTGPDHDRTFTVEVRRGEVMLAKGSGKSKKAAEIEAARTALSMTHFTQ